MRLVFISSLWLALALSSAPALAQQNPTVTSCGLPAGGFVTVDVTYSLSGDCVLTSILDVGFNVSMTINGNGHSIRAGAAVTQWILANQIPNDDRSVTLNNVTLNGQGAENAQAIHITDLTANGVTFRGNRRGIWDILNNPNGNNWSLTDVLFLDNEGSGFNNASVLEVRGSSALAMQNVAFVDNSRGSAAVKIVGGSAAVTAAGCFTYVANYPRTVRGSWTDNSTGQCNGPLGNGYQLAIPRAQRASCGFPAGGYLDSNVSFTLSDNCQLGRQLHITEDITVTINGNGYRIRGNAAGRPIQVAEGARVNLNNVILDGVRFINYGQIEGQLLVITGTAERALYNYGAVNFNQLLLRDLDHTSRAFNNAVIADYDYGRGGIDLRDSIFMNVNNGSSVATLWAWGATINLNGCVSFINNSPSNIRTDQGGSVNDNSSGPCPEGFIDQFPVFRVPPPSASAKTAETDKAPRPASVKTCPGLAPEILVTDLTGSTQCQRIGAAGVGRTDVLAAGLVDAVDVWSWVANNTRVCFQASGAGLVFRDSAYPPRPLKVLPAYRLGDLICAAIDGAGSVMLLNSAPAGLPSLSIRYEQTRTLSDCMATTNYILNLRDAPGGEVLDMLPYDITLTALQRDSGWFEVNYHGLRGWVSADYVTPNGACG